jgi:hypothetical protein
MGGFSINSTPEEVNEQRKKMMEFVQQTAKRNRFDEDLKRAKEGLYADKEDGKIYSRERGLGPSITARRLEEEHGVDIPGLIANKPTDNDMKKGGKVKKMASGGSASRRGDGIAQRGKTRGRMC